MILLNQTWLLVKSVMENDTEIYSFSFMVLDKGNELLQEGSGIVEDTIGMLETFFDVSDNKNDGIVWESLAN